MIKIADFDSTFLAAAPHDLEVILQRRHGKGVNAFWLNHDTEEYPKISILVNAELAAVHYIPEEFQAGFRSCGKTPGLEPNGTTAFSISGFSGDDVEEPNESVVPFSTALAVAKEFFASKQLPKCIDWSEL